MISILYGEMLTQSLALLDVQPKNDVLKNWFGPSPATADCQVCLVLGDADTLPYPDYAFDKILAINLISCLPYPLAVLKELYRVMKPSGRIALYFKAGEIFASSEGPVSESSTVSTLENVVPLLHQAGFTHIQFIVGVFGWGKGLSVLAERWPERTEV